jgi:hypothetical protein
MGTVLMIAGLACLLAAAVCGLIILIAAFQEDATQGLLCLCIPFYILYYGFARYESEHKPIILGIWIGGAILGNVLQFAGAAMSAS